MKGISGGVIQYLNWKSYLEGKLFYANSVAKPGEKGIEEFKQRNEGNEVSSYVCNQLDTSSCSTGRCLYDVGVFAIMKKYIMTKLRKW